MAASGCILGKYNNSSKCWASSEKTLQPPADEQYLIQQHVVFTILVFIIPVLFVKQCLVLWDTR